MEEPESKTPVVDNCPDCSKAIDVSALSPFTEIACPHCKVTVRMRRTMGQYHITGLLGEGGMSQVFKAVDIHLQREVALKVLHQVLSLDSSLTAMFEREAKLTASILHPNVVKVYTVGRDQGYFFIAMEIIDALSLEQMIADKGCLPEREVLHIAHDVTSGLKAAYDEGLIHRDIKPGNMLVMEDGTAKLVDFGLAVHQDGEDESEELWATPYYVPPEKLDGESDTHLGDIYSLGATLYHAVAGKPPFEANTSSMDELKEIKKQTMNLKGEAPSLSKPTLKLIEKMMAYRPEDRVESYEAILEKIEEIESKQFGAVSRERSTKRRSALPKVLVVCGLAVTVLVLVALGVQSKKEVEIEGGLGISAEERVISAGDNSNTGKFLEGRDWIMAGNFRKAEPIFDELVGETGMASATRMWSLYFQGLSRLVLGREVEARESFGYIAAVPDAGGAEMDQIRDFMARAAKTFSSPLPLLDGTEMFAGSQLEGMGLLTAAVKNWQQGQFESAIRLFDACDAVTVPAGFEWMKGLKSSAEPFKEDWRILQPLPNPNRKQRGELNAHQAALEAVVGKFQTRGATERLVKARLARIEAIREAEKQEKEVKVAPVSSVTQVPESDPAPVGVAADSGELSAAEQADREILLGALQEANGLQESLRFAEAGSIVSTLQVTSELGKSWQSELVSAYTEAAEFVVMVAAELDEQGFNGTIRRREGVPLDAEITSANPSFFVVDLGFGPNEVSVDQFSPDWLREVAESLMGEPTPSRIAEWEKVIFFSLATQQAGEAERLAAVVAAIDESFAQRWEIISKLRSG